MAEPIFFARAAPLTLSEIADIAGIVLPAGVDGSRAISDAAPLEMAGPGDLAYMDNARYADALAGTRAGVCLVSRRFADRPSPSSPRSPTRPSPARSRGSIRVR
jgi:UDP-3-O-[3-hydroxymyristoyl] glucosamine N-acyltransferase